MNQAGLTASPKLSLIYRNASGTVLGQTDVAITFNTDANFGQLAFYKITATTPTGTAKVRVQSSISNGYMKFDGLSLRNGTGTGSRTVIAEVPDVTVEVDGNPVYPKELTLKVSPNPSSNIVNLQDHQQ